MWPDTRSLAQAAVRVPVGGREAGSRFLCKHRSKFTCMRLKLPVGNCIKVVGLFSKCCSRLAQLPLVFGKYSGSYHVVSWNYFLIKRLSMLVTALKSQLLFYFFHCSRFTVSVTSYRTAERPSHTHTRVSVSRCSPSRSMPV